ncbi:MAG: hypothetical protein WC107_03245 [Patescibacteria group bacterium]
MTIRIYLYPGWMTVLSQLAMDGMIGNVTTNHDKDAGMDFIPVGSWLDPVLGMIPNNVVRFVSAQYPFTPCPLGFRHSGKSKIEVTGTDQLVTITQISPSIQTAIKIYREFSANPCGFGRS